MSTRSFFVAFFASIAIQGFVVAKEKPSHQKISISESDIVTWIYARRSFGENLAEITLTTKDTEVLKLVKNHGMDTVILREVLSGRVDVNKRTENGKGLSIAQMCAKKNRYSLLVAIAGNAKIDFSSYSDNDLCLLHRVLLQAPSIEYVKILVSTIKKKCVVSSYPKKTLFDMIVENYFMSEKDKLRAKKLLYGLVESDLVEEKILGKK